MAKETQQQLNSSPPVLRALLVILRALAGSLTWGMLVLYIMVIVRELVWLWLVLAVIVLVWLVRDRVRNITVRRVLGWVLPVYGDWLRFRTRQARKRGNRLVREFGLVPDTDKTKYRVLYWPSERVVFIEELPVYGFTRESLEKAVRQGLAIVHAADYSITPIHDKPNGYAVDFFDTPRVEQLKSTRVLDAPPYVDYEHGLRMLLGRNLQGDAWLDFSQLSGILIAGIPGSGKTVAARTILAGLASCPYVDVLLADGKGGGDWRWLSRLAVTYTDDDEYAPVLDMLRNAHALMRQRLASGDDFWQHGPDKNHHALVLMIDELQNWSNPVVSDKQNKADANEFNALLTSLVKRGRSAGIIVISATQKPTTDAIPSALRDMCAKRFVFRCTTKEMVRAALGEVPEGSPSSLDIPFDNRGLCVATCPDGSTEFVKFDVVSPQAIRELVASCARRHG